MFFPFRTSSIFRSRWIALFWAAGMIWMAVDIAGGASHGGDSTGATDNNAVTDASGAPVDAAQLNQAEKLLDQFGH